MCKIFIISLLSLFINSFATAQSVVPSVIMGRDTIPQGLVQQEGVFHHVLDLVHVLLHEVDVVARLKNPRKYARQQQRNLRMIHNVKKVFPYAKIAAAKINEIEYKLAQTDSEAKRKQIIKQEYKELMHTFKQPLMKLTVTQGKILVRLIYRETNNTSFNHIKEYKGTVNAYFWQSLALLFGNNLKADYEPNGRDREIEQIVRTLEKERTSHISRR